MSTRSNRKVITVELVLVRAVLIGTTAGGVMGAGIGTPAFPILGTAAGAAAGFLMGALVGLINGATLDLVHALARPWWCQSLVGGLTSGLCGWLIAAHLEIPVWLAAIPTALGLVLAPLAIRGGASRLDSASVTARSVVIGGSAGAAIGAEAGVIIGLVTYPPTAWAASIEGALLGGIPGALLGLLAAGAILLTHPLPA